MVQEHLMSRPSRARGLKPVLLGDEQEDVVVAPFTGAWIETRVRPL